MLRCFYTRLFVRRWIPVLALALLAPPAPAQEKVYVRHADGTVVQQFMEDVNAIKRDVADLKKDVAEIKAALGISQVKLAGSVPPPSHAEFRPAAPRAAVGHTHTCSKGHTWDHTLDGGSHRCPWCGEAEYTQDPPGRAVTASRSPVEYQLLTGPSFSAGCVNGSCSTGYTAPRRGLFGLRR